MGYFIVVVIGSRTVPIYFCDVFHSATKKFSAFRFELSIDDVKDITQN